MNRLLGFITISALLVVMVQNAFAQNNCSVNTIMAIKKDISLTIEDKKERLKAFVRQCKEYKRVRDAVLADIYFSQQDFKNAEREFTKAYRSKRGVNPINNDEMRAKYALVLHFQAHKAATVHAIFMELRDKYNDNLPEKIKQIYMTYKISLAKQIVPKELLLAALSSTKSYKNLIICPSINVTINFDYNSDRIRFASKAQVQEIGEALMAPKLSAMGYQYELIGHTDIRGDELYNQRLSQKRASSVKNALIRLEPDLKETLSIIGKGESEPDLPGNTEDIHRVNRRVEIRIACDN